MKKSPISAWKRPRRRPVKHVKPERIPDTAEGVAEAIFSGPPKEKRRFVLNENYRRA